MITDTGDKKKFYTARNDVAFKCAFLGDKDTDLLKNLLEYCLKEKIESIEILYNEQARGVNIANGRLDCIVKTDIGKILVEVNSSKKTFTNLRNALYLFYAMVEEYDKSENISENIRFMQINLSYGLSKKKKPISVYKLQDSNQEEFIKNLEIREFNMEYYEEFWYNKDKQGIIDNLELVMLNRDLEELRELSKMTKGVDKFMKRMETVNSSDEYRPWLTREEMHELEKNGKTSWL